MQSIASLVHIAAQAANPGIKLTPTYHMQKKERKNAGVSLLMERIYLSNLCAATQALAR